MDRSKSTSDAIRPGLASVARAGVLALSGFFVLAFAPPMQAQTFDQAVFDALGTGGPPADGPACMGASGNLATVCGDVPGLTAAASGGSTTGLTNESAPSEDRRTEHLMGPFNVFFSAEYERFDKDLTTFEPAHETDSARATLGADYSVNDSFLVGGALKYGNDDGDFDAGGDFETDSYGVLLFANFMPIANAFVGASAGYMHKDSDISRLASITRTDGVTTVLGLTDADTDGSEYSIGLNGGYDFSFQNVTVGPRVGLNYRRTKIDSYRESGSTGLELAYDSQTEKSLTGVLGIHASVAISTSFGVLVPQATVEYVHEFEDDQRGIDFRFVDNLSAGRFRFENDSPDRNYYNLGLGVAAVFPHGISAFVNARALVGYDEHSSYKFSAGVRMEF